MVCPEGREFRMEVIKTTPKYSRQISLISDGNPVVISLIANFVSGKISLISQFGLPPKLKFIGQNVRFCIPSGHSLYFLLYLHPISWAFP